jgi:iron complex outermembrane receptor protein
MKHLPLLASLFGCLSVNTRAQSTVDLAPISIDG